MIILIQALFFLLILLASYVTWFAFWKKLEDEHIDDIEKVFDKVFLAILVGFLAGKLAYMLTLIRFPFTGLSSIFSGNLTQVIVPVSIGIGCFALYKFLVSTQKDPYHILDLSSISIALWFGLMSGILGIRHGLFMLTGQFNLSIVPLLFFFVSVGVFGILSWFLSFLELRYRTFLWYRYRRSSAQSGFVLAVFLIVTGIWQTILTVTGGDILKDISRLVSFLFFLLCIVGGFVILYVRSGRWKSKS